MITSLAGDAATGKTTWAYTAPLKIVGLQFDMGVKRALMGAKREWFKDADIQTIKYLPDPNKNNIEPFNPTIFDDADITIFELPPPIQLDQIEIEGAIDLWYYFLIRIGEAFRHPDVHSIVVDTMTVARRVKANAYLEKLQKKAKAEGNNPRERLIQIEWGNPNDAVRDVFNAGEATQKNLIATHHLRDERVDQIGGDGKIEHGVKSGNKILEGLENTDRLVDVSLRIHKDGANLTSEFLKCGYDLTLEGQTQAIPTWDSLVEIIEQKVGKGQGLERRRELQVADSS